MLMINFVLIVLFVNEDINFNFVSMVLSFTEGSTALDSVNNWHGVCVISWSYHYVSTNPNWSPCTRVYVGHCGAACAVYN